MAPSALACQAPGRPCQGYSVFGSGGVNSEPPWEEVADGAAVSSPGERAGRDPGPAESAGAAASTARGADLGLCSDAVRLSELRGHRGVGAELRAAVGASSGRSEEHTSELQS